MKFVFKVTFIPKASWVDDIYLGNMLIEVLAAIRDRQNVFDFEVSKESVS
ncbi:MAG: hypothetical protein NZ896_04905 [Nitrososphaerales archaeon]|nr:hypothetical protein [Nitrososphaerales archaeon]